MGQYRTRARESSVVTVVPEASGSLDVPSDRKKQTYTLRVFRSMAAAGVAELTFFQHTEQLLKIEIWLHLDFLSIPQSGGGNVKTFRWNHRLQR